MKVISNKKAQNITLIKKNLSTYLLKFSFWSRWLTPHSSGHKGSIITNLIINSTRIIIFQLYFMLQTFYCRSWRHSSYLNYANPNKLPRKLFTFIITVSKEYLFTVTLISKREPAFAVNVKRECNWKQGWGARLARENVSRLYWHLNENAADTAIKTTTRSRKPPTHMRTITNYLYLNTIKISPQSGILKSKHWNIT